MQEYKGTKTITASSKEEWRKWLEKNHESKDSIWLIIYKKNSGKLSVYYDEAVNEALCFGWIDSKINKKDEVSYYQYFSKRNPKSNWSKVNKTKITQLLSQGKMHKSGLKIIEQAKKSGTWSALDDVENLILPKDLKECFNKNKIAYTNWKGFPRSSKRAILEWIFNAKRAETRKSRIDKTVEMASLNKRANHY